MALPKPAKSKAPAPTQPVGGYTPQRTNVDSCCIPVQTPSNTSWSGKDSAGGPAATSHILNPTAH